KAISLAECEQFAFARDTLVIHEVELCCAEWGCDFIFDHLYAMTASDNLIAFFDLCNTANIETYRRVEFERLTSRGRLGITKHNADLHSDLVNEDDDCL